MKNLFYSLSLLFILVACTTDENDPWTEYAKWRDDNNEWIKNQALIVNPDGSLYYERVVPAWNHNAYVLIHYFNDRSETAGNLSPLFTSTVAVKYIGRLYNDTVFDSSYSMPDSIFTTTSANVISGWQIALADMHVGDTCEVLIPYEEAYFGGGSGVVLPYSCLKFNMKLVDIPYYEVKP
ncbi:MAG: FKBP-type peptidyl-prolyl cis-trans isomerase [Muribaculaceae bacterium]|nr:FKBP-type peptidyl-prolyl cis-trans isomerase [Muribaculaceae bacterium]